MYNLIVYTALRNDLGSDCIKYSKPINAKIVSFRIHVRAEQPAGRQPESGEWAGDGPLGAQRCSHRVYTHRPGALYTSLIFLGGCEL